MRTTLICVLFLLAKGFAGFSQCDLTTNLALGQPAVASSLESGAYPASNAFDGDTTGTRWSSAFSDPQYIYVDLGAVYNICQVNLYWENAYGTSFTIDLSNDASTWTTAASISGNTSTTNVISISGSGRYVRMYGTTRATMYGYSLYEMKVFGPPTAATCNTTNLALGQAAVASSLENAGLPASNAVDGDMTTRWSSAFSDPQYIYVDLGSVHNLCKVTLYWEAAYASSYNIDVSNDASTWTTLASVTGNTSTTNIVSVAGSGRYVRMYGLTRIGTFGYSLYEMQVTDRTLLPITLAYFGAANENNKYVQLQWTTSQEINNSYFSIERSADGISYKSIARVNSSGNSYTDKSYNLLDSFPLKGINYYRLLQVDADGKSTYSKVVTVNLDATTVAHVLAYPNPVVDQVTVSGTGNRLIRAISLYDAAGAELLRKTSLAGSNSITLSTAGLHSGVYFVKVSTDKGMEIIKLLK